MFKYLSGNIGNHNSYQDFVPSEVSPNYSNIERACDADPSDPNQFTLTELRDLWIDDISELGSNIFRGRIADSYNVNLTSNYAQSQMWITMGDYWACQNVNGNKTADDFNSYLFQAIKENQVTTISIGNILESDTVGQIPAAQMTELSLIKDFVRDNNCNYEDILSVTIENVKTGLPINALNNDDKLILTQNSNGDNDQWIIEDIPDLGSEDLVRIFNTKTHKYIAVKFANTGATAKIIQDYWYDTPEQKWVIQGILGETSKKIQNYNSSMYAGVEYIAPGASAENAKIQQNPWFNWNSQKWFIQPTTITISSRNSLDKSNSGLRISPNPTNSKIYISINNDEFINELELISISGNSIKTKSNLKTNSCSMSLENLESGFYFIKVLTNKKSYLRKIVKE